MAIRTLPTGTVAPAASGGMAGGPPRTYATRMRGGAACLALLLLAASGCNYGFRGGGGFPASIKTVYIAPFDNETAQFQVSTELFQAMMDRVPRALGVKPSGEQVADAVIRGKVVRYDDSAQNYRASSSTQTQTPTVVQNQVQIAVSIQIIDTKRNVILWESSSLVGKGQYQPDNQDDSVGRKQAEADLVQQMIDGAQSQW